MAHDYAELSRRWFEQVWNQRRPEAAADLLEENGVIHGLGDGGKALRGAAGFRPFFDKFINAFPDLRITVDEVLVDGDRSAVRLHADGTHRGEGLGIPPTGRQMAVTAMVFIHWRNGRILEGWNEFDAMGMLQQLTNQPMAAVKA